VHWQFSKSISSLKPKSLIEVTFRGRPKHLQQCTDNSICFTIITFFALPLQTFTLALLCYTSKKVPHQAQTPYYR
jgi:hypothetical protein